jgi:molybdenum cofactor cytidylyltransferase
VIEERGGGDVVVGLTDCIVLAAGASTRMGGRKLHLPFGRSTVLGATVDAALAAGLRVIVVGRPDDSLLEAFAIPGRVLLAINPEPDRGMLSSLRAGLVLSAQARNPAHGFFFIPADMPLVKTSSYEALLARRHVGPVIATFRGRRGHPVFMPPALSDAVLALPNDGNLRALIDASKPLFVETDDEGTVTDIDYPYEYESATALHAEGISSSCIPRVGA